MKRWIALLVTIIVGMVFASRCSIPSYDGYDHSLDFGLDTLEVVRSEIEADRLNVAVNVERDDDSSPVRADVLSIYRQSQDLDVNGVLVVFLSDDVRSDGRWAEITRWTLRVEDIDLLLTDLPETLEELSLFVDEHGSVAVYDELPLFDGF